MKTGRTLSELAAELTRQSNDKVDYIAPTAQLQIIDERKAVGDKIVADPKLRVNGHGQFGINEIAHDQIGERVGIPAKYYDRLRSEAPDLLATNVNHWFAAKPENRLVRLLDGKARAFLSDAYRPLDNHDLAEVSINTLIKADAGVRIESTEVTESRLYIKAVTERIQGEVRPGDILYAGIVITNSEVGLGALKIEQLVYRLVCRNGAIAGDTFRRAHVGGRRGGQDVEEAREYFKTETRAADDRAFWLKVRDVVAGSFDKERFEALLQKNRDAANRKIEADPIKVLEVAQVKFGLTDDERNGVLKHLLRSDDLTQYGLHNAVTAFSQDVKDYDKATDLERLGGRIIELPKTDWQELATAAGAN